jgi:hypothetical protein
MGHNKCHKISGHYQDISFEEARRRGGLHLLDYGDA